MEQAVGLMSQLEKESPEERARVVKDLVFSAAAEREEKERAEEMEEFDQWERIELEEDEEKARMAATVVEDTASYTTVCMPKPSAPKSPAPAAAKEDHVPTPVRVVHELCPGRDIRFVAHVVNNTCGGDVATAATWLLDRSPEEVDAAENAFLASAAAPRGRPSRRQSRGGGGGASVNLPDVNSDEDAAALRALIVNRYDLQAVRQGGSSGGATGKVLMWGEQQQQKAGGGKAAAVRYHNGQVVSTRGEKYIVEKTKEEWDGGSRGRVKTKGKRGPGYVG
jgi:hypothetical protein